VLKVFIPIKVSKPKHTSLILLFEEDDLVLLSSIILSHSILMVMHNNFIHSCSFSLLVVSVLIQRIRFCFTQISIPLSPLWMWTTFSIHGSDTLFNIFFVIGFYFLYKIYKLMQFYSIFSYALIKYFLLSITNKNFPILFLWITNIIFWKIKYRILFIDTKIGSIFFRIYYFQLIIFMTLIIIINKIFVFVVFLFMPKKKDFFSIVIINTWKQFFFSIFFRVDFINWLKFHDYLETNQKA